MINVQCYGCGVPLVFFHGFGFDHSIWLPLVHNLSGYKCYLVDLPGFGDSSNISWEDFKQQLLAQLPTKFTLVGWSMGGLYATRLSIEALDRVTYVLNIASLPYFIADKDWPAVDRAVFVKFHQQMLASPDATLREFIHLHAKGSDYKPKYIAPQSLDYGLQVLLEWDLRKCITTNSIGYVFGGLDAIVPRKMRIIMQYLYSGVNFWYLPRAAHAPFLSHKDEMVQIINQRIPA